MHPALALALVLVVGIGITRLSRPSFRPPSLLADLVATGVPFLLLGLLLGPGLGVIDAAGLRLLQPVVALGIGWSGALFGAQLEWRMMRRVSGHAWLIGATLALPVLLVTAATAWMLAHALPALAESWGRPSLAVALVLGGALTTAASQRGPRLGRRNALFDTAFGAAAVIIGVALYHPHGAVRNIILTLLVGGGLGSLFVALARGAMLNEPRDASVAAFAVILWGAGFSYAAGLSPFVVCALEGAVFMSFSPVAVRRVVAELLSRWELPLYAAFLIVAGALLRPLTAWVVLAALALALIRVLVRWVTVRFGLDQVDPVWRSLPFAPPPEFAHSAIRQGAGAVALAAGFDLVRGAPAGGAVLVTILLCVMATEAIAALTPLTARPSQTEVS
ncbi:MAG: hypothetical protein AUH41_04765 [Gemmatimonadetes bacterium 13_1_40CM_66_11]|nr:MAG: hypothetical protein AUH41_04765 [Gemmatimonadetes bacterium 13_1_40CM_66_11]